LSIGLKVSRQYKHRHGLDCLIVPKMSCWLKFATK
jgi:hypothetical protein